MLKDQENDQCNIRKGAQRHNGDFSRVEISLLDKKLSGWLFNCLSFWWREVLVSKSIHTMYKIGNTKLCTFLLHENNSYLSWSRETKRLVKKLIEDTKLKSHYGTDWN